MMGPPAESATTTDPLKQLTGNPRQRGRQEPGRTFQGSRLQRELAASAEVHVFSRQPWHRDSRFESLQATQQPPGRRRCRCSPLAAARSSAPPATFLSTLQALHPLTRQPSSMAIRAPSAAWAWLAWLLVGIGWILMLSGLSALQRVSRGLEAAAGGWLTLWGADLRRRKRQARPALGRQGPPCELCIAAQPACPPHPFLPPCRTAAARSTPAWALQATW